MENSHKPIIQSLINTSKHSKNIIELIAALKLLRKVYAILINNIPTKEQADTEDISNYFSIMLKTESNITDLVVNISNAVAELISQDLCNNVFIRKN